MRYTVFMSFEHHQKRAAHWVAYTPLLFFVVLLGGVVLHINVPVVFVSPIVGWTVGVALLLMSPILIVWAQRMRHTLYVPVEDRTCKNFNVGPYRISRHPTYLGMFLLLIGFSFLIDSFPMLLMTLTLGPIFTFFLIPTEEKILEDLCGDVYREYKKKVRMWL
jgi:protein-S-isoprenylcysteine O-methyltransferase Ste14